MKKTILSLLVFLCSLILSAQAPAPLEGQARDKAISSVLKANDIRTSLQLRFTMKRHSSLLKEDLVSRGRAFYVYPDKLRWEVEQPQASVFVLNGTANVDRRFQNLYRNLSKIQEKGLINETDFSVKVYAAPGQWQVDMVPLRRDLGQLFALITLLADSATGELRAIVLTETSGDTSYLELNSVVKGQPIDESLFKQP